MTAFRVEVTKFMSDSASLSKRLELINSEVANDSSNCLMVSGTAIRVVLDSMQAVADFLDGHARNEAYALGRIKDGHPDRVKVVLKSKLAEANGDPATIARTLEYLEFAKGKPGLDLIDIDRKGMPESIENKIKANGGYWDSLCKVCPKLAPAGRVGRHSTSYGLRNAKTGDKYPDSGGVHFVIAVADAVDIPRFQRDLHDRSWLKGYGWGMVSAAGTFLERSLTDRNVGSPERLIFEAPPVVEPPLKQDPRAAHAQEGDVVDTMIACPPLTDAERAEVEQLKDDERARLKPEMDKQRTDWSDRHVKRMVASGVPKAEAKASVDHWIDTQELSGDFPLTFDDPKLAGATVAKVLSDPDKYANKTLADPFEGVSYGRGKAILYKRDDGSLSIKSYAHGDTRYELKTPPKPTIKLIVGETERIVNELETRLIASDRGLYQRGGIIVSTGFAKMKTWDKQEVIVQIIEERGNYAMGEDLEAVASFLGFDKKGKMRPCNPPKALISTLKDRKSRLRLPILTGIVNCPSISVSGELLDRPGYGEDGVLFDPLGIEFPRVPERSTKAMAETALARILHVIETFPFETEDDRAVGTSGIITGVARRGLDFAPLHGFDAPVAGAGKSKLVDIIAIIATGRRAAVMSQGDPEEFAKALAAALMQGGPIVSIDNCSRPLEGDLLNQVQTQLFVQLRPLGKSILITVQTKALITATGNNLHPVGDLTRRGVVGRLDPKCERPELNQFDFDPIAHAMENRAQLVVDCLTILRAYHCAGRPDVPLRLQSFEHWSDTVRGALIWLGQGDPVRTIERLRKDDTAFSNLIAVFSAWWDEFSDERVSADEVIERAEAHLFVDAPGSGVTNPVREKQFTRPRLRNALMAVAKKHGQLDAVALKYWLRSAKQRVVLISEIGREFRVALTTDGEKHAGVVAWKLQMVS